MESQLKFIEITCYRDWFLCLFLSPIVLDLGALVSSLLCGTGAWNEELISKSFIKEEARKIL